MKTVTIPLVVGDGMTAIRFRLDDAASAMPLESLLLGTTTAHMLFREAGSVETIADIELSKVDGGVNSEVQLSFIKDAGGSWLDGLTAGAMYEGQMYLLFNGVKQTVLTRIRFPLKEAFADA